MTTFQYPVSPLRGRHETWRAVVGNDPFSSYRIRLITPDTNRPLARIGGLPYYLKRFRARKDHRACANCGRPMYRRQLCWRTEERRGKWRKTYIHKACLL